MKVVIILILGLMATTLFADNKVKCENLFKSAIENFYLENSCNFNKHVSSLIRQEFENQQCSELFDNISMKKLNSIVLGDSYKKMNNMGRDKFCQENKKKYEKLYIKYKK